MRMEMLRAMVIADAAVYDALVGHQFDDHFASPKVASSADRS